MNMSEIPIFDSLVHPTIKRTWLSPKCESIAFIDDLLEQMLQNNIAYALAVGMKGIGDYEEDAYIDFIRNRSEKLLPIAFYDFDYTSRISEIRAYINDIKQKGYAGIKLHPRIGNFLLNDERLPVIVDAANEAELAVLLCTYFYSNKQSLQGNNIDELYKMLLHIDPSSKVVLLHAGAVKLLEMMELTRVFQNTLLDLSFTLCKYEGSSLDMDINFLFKNFDRRICIGSDWPEISIKNERERFNKFAESISREKAENIAFRNLQKFVNLNIR